MKAVLFLGVIKGFLILTLVMLPRLHEAFLKLQ